MNPSEANSRSRWLAVALWTLPAFIIALLLTRADLSAFDQNTFVNVLFALLRDGALAGVWFVAAFGFGSALKFALFRARHWPLSVQWAIGIALLLFIDHALGAAGLLQSASSALAWATIAIGWIAVLIALAKHKTSKPVAESAESMSGPWPWWSVSMSVAMGVLLVAATSAPGWLWSSEAHGYDVLEYHLQLPKEWVNAGRITPLPHLAYSFLPNYMEGAFYHLALLSAPFTPDTSHPALQAAIASQLLHAFITVLAAFVITQLTHRWLSAIIDPARRNLAATFAPLAGALFITLPWTVVTGSMAYNESAAVLCFAAALYLFVDLSDKSLPMTFWRTALLVGFLTGTAVGAKLTSLGNIALPLGLVFLYWCWSNRRWRSIIVVALSLTFGAIGALAPYLIRNAVVLQDLAPGSRNVLFPLFTEVLGQAHWSAEQSARWTQAHQVHLDWPDRFARLWSQGFVHVQWAGLWFTAVIASIIAITLGPRQLRRLAIACLLLVLAQLAFWFTFTHMQSRFLITSALPLAVVCATAFVALANALHTPRMRFGLAIIAALWTLGQVAVTVTVFTRERKGAPATYLDGIALRSAAQWNNLEPAAQQILLDNASDVFLTIAIPEDRGIYLLGDATPFYILRPVIWHDTWSASPLGNAIRKAPDNPQAWVDELAARGIDYILLNESELHRLSVVDGWYDPDVTIERVHRLIDDHTTFIRAWPGAGNRIHQALYRLNPDS